MSPGPQLNSHEALFCRCARGDGGVINGRYWLPIDCQSLKDLGVHVGKSYKRPVGPIPTGRPPRET